MVLHPRLWSALSVSKQPSTLGERPSRKLTECAHVDHGVTAANAAQ